ncbi:MAG: hypothetical protein II670_13845 [Alphaproteobacteria bacterium]|nr:hypothetical protein [Alphaproteobacteria bacterium]
MSDIIRTFWNDYQSSPAWLQSSQAVSFFFYSAIGLPFFIFFLHGETGDIGDIAIIANIATSKICTGTLGTLS